MTMFRWAKITEMGSLTQGTDEQSLRSTDLGTLLLREVPRIYQWKGILRDTLLFYIYVKQLKCKTPDYIRKNHGEKDINSTL